MAGPDGKRIIDVDPEIGPLITHLFGWYATGTLSLKEAAEEARRAGLVYPRTGRPVPVSTIHTILRNRLYTGEFEWHGALCKGRHRPLVTHELWERVQGVLDGRNARKPRRSAHDFAFSGLIACGHCGCSMVGEIKKGRYTYYHCTGYKGNCGEPYVREEVIEAQFSDLLGRLSFSDEILAWVSAALRDSHADEQQEHETAVARLYAESERLQRRIHAMYVDKLDGRVEKGFFESMSAQWRDEQERCLREIRYHQAADQSYLAEGVRLLELAHGAQRMFARQAPREKRKLLNFVLSNCTWQKGHLTPTFRQPFDLIAETAMLAKAGKAAGGRIPDRHPSWLGHDDGIHHHAGPHGLS